jgi:hypothetical protein
MLVLFWTGMNEESFLFRTPPMIFFCAIIRQSGEIYFLEGIFGDIFSLFQWMKSPYCYQFQGGIPLFKMKIHKFG